MKNNLHTIYNKNKEMIIHAKYDNISLIKDTIDNTNAKIITNFKHRIQDGNIDKVVKTIRYYIAKTFL